MQQQAQTDEKLSLWHADLYIEPKLKFPHSPLPEITILREG